MYRETLLSCGAGQDHVRNWAVALNANVWTSPQHDSLVPRTNIPQFLIWIYRTYSCAFIKYSLTIPPHRFLPSFFLFVSQWILQLDCRLYGAENALQANLLLEMLEEMFCWTLKFLQSLHNSRTWNKNCCISDWLEPRIRKQVYC